MRRTGIAFLAILAILVFSAPLLVLSGPAPAQQIPESLSGRSEDTIRQQINTWTVGMVGGLISGTYMRYADDLAKAIDDGPNMRVLPIVSHGAASNLDDLLYLRGIDLAITQSDVFEYFRTVRETPNLQERIHYVIRLPISEVHILGRREFKTLEDLRGQKVSFGPAGAGSSLTGPIIFDRLGIEVEGVNANSPDSLQMLQSGEIAAMIRMVGKPIEFFDLPDSDLHFIPVPFTDEFTDYYTLGEFTHEDYPALVPQGERVETLAVPTVLAVYNWRDNADRFRRVERFIERLFENWEQFQDPPFHRKWRDVNLAATVPGWQRFSVAERLVEEMADQTAASVPEDLNSDFHAYLADQPDGGQRTQEEREKLFKEFLRWREQRAENTN